MRAAMGADEFSAILDVCDWGATTVGAPADWPAELAFAVTTVMPSAVPMMIWWGQDLVQIYNAAYVPLLGDKHPTALGQAASQCWAEAWESVEPSVRGVLTTGKASFHDLMPLWIERHGFIEETHWTFSLSPIREHGSGRVLGLLSATTERTEDVVTRRRLRSLRHLGEVSTSQGAADAAEAALEAVCGPDLDIRSAGLYRLRADDSVEQVAMSGDCEHGAGDVESLVHVCAAAGRAQACERREEAPDAGAWSFTELCNAKDHAPGPPLLCLPLGAHAGAVTLVLVMAVSPHLPFNEQFRTYLDLIAGQMNRIIRDTSTYEDERRRRRQLADLDAAKSRLFQNISHEFRTPLTMIHAPQVSLLKRRGLNLTDDERADLAAAVRATERLQRLVDGLLEVARGQADRIVTNLEATSVPEITQEGVAMFRAAADSAGLELTLSVVEDFPDSLLVDRELWMRVLLNLVSNAVKYTAEGHIAVGLDYRDGNVILEVADTGLGITEDDLPHIFDRFHQARTKPVRGDSGSGIGLALVAELLRAVGGSATVDSVVGRGTTVVVRLPASLAGEPASSSMDRVLAGERAELALLQRAPDPSGIQPGGDSAGRGRILVVEDNADLCDYMGRLLHSAGWCVTGAASAEEAMEAMQGQDVVVSDVMLPGLSGLDLVRWIRQEADCRWTPVLLLTARAGTDSVIEGLSAGADDFVTKPFEPDELLARVATHMELSLLRRVVLDEAEDRAANLQRALSSNRLIGTALGIIMATEKITADEAFARLRGLSQHTNRKLRDVADDVVFTGALPS